MMVCFFGAYDPGYPRNSVIRKGLRLNGVEVAECRVQPKYKFWLRYPLLFSRCLGHLLKYDFFFVPEFCQKDVPLAKFLSLVASKKVIFDPLAPRFETKIKDWKRRPPGSWQAGWNLEIDSWAFKLSDLVLADTQAHKDYYCRNYAIPPEKVEILPVGYDDELYRPCAALKKEEQFTVLFFGSFLPLHGVELILEAARIISAEKAPIKFRLVGSGQTFPRARQLASELGLSNVQFEGWLAQRELPQRIAASDICLGIFGKTEKARRVVPHKIFQAMGMRKPVITARTPAVEEFFKHRENIFLVDELEPGLLAKAILELERDTDLRGKIAEKGFGLVSRDFSPKAIGRALVGIIERKFAPHQGIEIG
jgi:glycosyltransferase involved in cell wall biosynthesis